MILHIMFLEKKFIPQFIKFVNQNFSQNHKFLIISHKEDVELKNIKNVEFITKKSQFLSVIIQMNKADKIIFHSMSSKHIQWILFLNPWLLQKGYWFTMGADFYNPEKKGYIEKFVRKHIANVVTYVKGDFELIQKWYHSKANYIECFKYLSNLYKDLAIPPKTNDTIYIQIGVADSPIYNHIEVLQSLEKYKNKNIKIILPLSYGNTKYRDKIISFACDIFGDKVEALVDFLPLNKYLEIISNVDIAIFDNDRQKGMGNIISLLGFGKKVYMRKEITPFKMFTDLGVKVFDIKELNLDLIDESTKKDNIRIIKEHFSEKNYKSQLEKIFGE